MSVVTKIPVVISDVIDENKGNAPPTNNNERGAIENNNNSEMKNKIDNVNGNEELDFDDLLPLAGEFGTYQLYLFLLTMPFYMYGAFVYFVQMFMTEIPSEHWCWIPELANLTDIERRSLAIPPDENGRYGYSQCTSYSANWTEILNTGIKPGPNWETVPCQHGWEFDRTEIPYDTVGTDFEWVCERASYQATAQSIFFTGSVFGGFLIGWVADRFGRLPGAIISNLIGCVGGIASIFARNFGEFVASRFLVGMAFDNCMIMMYILVLEYIAPKYRTVLSNMAFAFFYTTGACALPWIALACGHWKTLSLVISVSLALPLLAPLVVPESPRWLLSKGRIEDAIKKLLTISRVNKKEIPPKLIEQFRTSANSAKANTEKLSVIELLKRPALRKIFILICLEYVCCSIVFDSLARSVGQLGLNFFVSFTAVSVTEFPSLVVVAFIMDWMGRRWLASIFLVICCIFSLLTVFVGAGLSSVLCAAMARFAVNISYNAAIQWAAEMLPTGVRASGVSAVHICGYIATMISPYIVYLDTVLVWLPMAIVGCVAATGAIIAMILPETAKKDMPQTFDEAEELVKNQKFWEMPCMPKRVQKQTAEVYCNESFEI